MTISNPSHEMLLQIATSIAQYVATLEHDLFEEEMGNEASHDEMARKAGFTASLSLYFNNIGALVGTDELEKQARQAVELMDDAQLSKYNKETIITAPEIFQHYLLTLQQWMKINIDKELENIINITGDQLDLDPEQYADEVKEGAKDIFLKWLDNYHTSLIDGTDQSATITPEIKANFSAPQYN